jgi:hypothetical protein
MAKNGNRIPGFEDEVEDKLRQAQDRVRKGQDGVASHAKRHDLARRQLDGFKAGMQKIQGDPAPLIAERLKALEKSAVNVAEDKQRATRELAAAEQELAEFTLARDQLKQMRG